MVKRFAVLGVLFAVVGGKAAQRDRDQVAAPLQIFQQQRRAQLRHGTDRLPVKALVRHQLQCLAHRAVELREGEKVVDRRRDKNFKLKFLRKLGKDVAIPLPVQEEKNIGPYIKRGGNPQSALPAPLSDAAFPCKRCGRSQGR